MDMHEVIMVLIGVIIGIFILVIISPFLAAKAYGGEIFLRDSDRGDVLKIETVIDSDLRFYGDTGKEIEFHSDGEWYIDDKPTRDNKKIVERLTRVFKTYFTKDGGG
jgi:hypothetical protein